MPVFVIVHVARRGSKTPWVISICIEEVGSLPIGPVEVGPSHYAPNRLGYTTGLVKVWSAELPPAQRHRTVSQVDTTKKKLSEKLRRAALAKKRSKSP